MIYPSNEIPLILRVCEGMSTGFMFWAYYLYGKQTLTLILVYMIHWFMSFRYHITLRNINDDFIWIQFVSCERVFLCNPHLGMILLLWMYYRIHSIKKNSYNLQAVLSNYTKEIATLSTVIYFLSIQFLCKKGYSFLISMILSSLINWFNAVYYHSIQKRNPYVTILFHITLGYGVYVDYSRDCCLWITNPFSHVNIFVYIYIYLKLRTNTIKNNQV